MSGHDEGRQAVLAKCSGWSQLLLAGTESARAVTRVAFADESGITSKFRCYGIGIVTVQQSDRDSLESNVRELKLRHGVLGEAKWKKVSNGHGTINFVLDCLSLILTSPSATFDAMVVRKDLFNNWQGGVLQREKAFYQTYTLLLQHIAKRVNESLEVWVDGKSDHYPKYDEVMRAIGNRMLSKLAVKGSLGTITKASSHDTIGIQLADVLIGAINTAHLLRIQEISIHNGKRLAIARLARQLGWDHLGYDTFPHAKFNVWHFPVQHRGPSRDPIPSGVVPYVTPDDLAAV
jgi:hypothetical protein